MPDLVPDSFRFAASWRSRVPITTALTYLVSAPCMLALFGAVRFDGF
jgi:hypothetical protein